LLCSPIPRREQFLALPCSFPEHAAAQGLGNFDLPREAQGADDGMMFAVGNIDELGSLLRDWFSGAMVQG
jgi:hypothetical protein